MELDCHYSEYGLVALSSVHLRKGVVEQKMIETLRTSSPAKSTVTILKAFLRLAPSAAMVSVFSEGKSHMNLRKEIPDVIGQYLGRLIEEDLDLLIVDTFDARNHMRKTPLRDVAPYPRSFHECRDVRRRHIQSRRMLIANHSQELIAKNLFLCDRLNVALRVSAASSGLHVTAFDCTSPLRAPKCEVCDRASDASKTVQDLAILARSPTR
jgi:hypothetical protein